MNRKLVQLVLLVLAMRSRCQTHSVDEASEFGHFGHQLERRFNQMEARIRELTDRLEDQNRLLQNLHSGTSPMMFDPAHHGPPPEFGQQNNLVDRIQVEPSERRNWTMPGKTIELLYEHNQYGSGWIVIQNRFNGSVDFYRNWANYRDGFGSLDGEFWLGLEKIHLLTSSRDYELMVHLESFDGETKFARYGLFAIGGEHEGYMQGCQMDFSDTLKFFIGTAGDSLTHHIGMKFSTLDRENDISSYYNCAVTCKGGWWYKDCVMSNLNGLIQNKTHHEVMFWNHFNDRYLGLKSSKMMIREVKTKNAFCIQKFA